MHTLHIFASRAQTSAVVSGQNLFAAHHLCPGMGASGALGCQQGLPFGFLCFLCLKRDCVGGPENLIPVNVGYASCGSLFSAMVQTLPCAMCLWLQIFIAGQQQAAVAIPCSCSATARPRRCRLLVERINQSSCGCHRPDAPCNWQDLLSSHLSQRTCC